MLPFFSVVILFGQWPSCAALETAKRNVRTNIEHTSTRKIQGQVESNSALFSEIRSKAGAFTCISDSSHTERSENSSVMIL